MSPALVVKVPRLAVNIELPEPPSANRWWRKFRNRMVKSAQARAYQHALYLRLYASGHRKPIPKGRRVRVDVYWNRGPILTPSKGAYYAGDLDKRLGILLDALQGTAYTNDSQVVELHAFRLDVSGPGYVRVHVYDLA